MTGVVDTPAGGISRAGASDGGRVAARDAAAGAAMADSAIEAVLRPLMPELLAYFARRIRPLEDAADCLSEALLVIWRRRAEWPAEIDAQRAWCFGVARGVLANQRRGHVRRGALADRLRGELSVAHPPVPAVAFEVRGALARLSDRDRELVTLVAWDGFGVAEAGDLLGLKPDTARARYSRARRKLRELLG